MTDGTGDVTAVLVRHGETAWNRNDRLQGWAPVSLSDRGRDQARALGEYLGTAYDVDRVVASDLRRTRETAALLRESGVEPTPAFSRAWRERDVGVFQGLTREQAFGYHPQYRAASGVMGARAMPEGGESLVDLHERVVGAWQRLLDVNDAGETVLVVTHGGPIYVLLGYLSGVDLPGAFVEYSHDNCGVTEVRVPGGNSADARVVRENERVVGDEHYL